MQTDSQTQMLNEAFYDSEFLNYMKSSSFEKMIDGNSEAPSMLMAKVVALIADGEPICHWAVRQRGESCQVVDRKDEAAGNAAGGPLLGGLHGHPGDTDHSHSDLDPDYDARRGRVGSDCDDLRAHPDDGESHPDRLQ